jgi:RNA polymerase sigma-70 factor (ECF subfamily)
VFLVAWRRFDSVPTGDQILPWLYATGRRVLANQRRSRTRFVRLTARLRSNPEKPLDGPEITVIRNEQNQGVLDALARLRPRDREVIQLALWEELSHAGIGEVLGCSARAATMRLHRALRRLRRELHSRQILPFGPTLAPYMEATNE